ncbi:Protein DETOXIFICATION 16 [Dichanthelium oligosanthes]|uniref:Protein DETOXIFICATION 16 n=1 Tax=Dichanthelium oligosanthes TaxID=888268 RepID=A0A1E5W706_9POAL|nr:Protein DETOXIFICATION 16 [Dichanthelium oligosanthes]
MRESPAFEGGLLNRSAWMGRHPVIEVEFADAVNDEVLDVSQTVDDEIQAPNGGAVPGSSRPPCGGARQSLRTMEVGSLVSQRVPCARHGSASRFPTSRLNTANCLFMVPYGLGAAISTCVSNELGVGRPLAARLAVRVVMFLAVSEGLVMGSVLICVRYIWGHAYSDEEEVVRYVARMMLILAVSNFFDGIQCVLSDTHYNSMDMYVGVARGCGWQKIGACVNLGAFYIVGVPAAYLIAFVLRVGGMGLWTGIICGIVVQVVLLVIITLCTDWQKEATKAKNRVFDSSLPTDLAAT